MNAVSETNHFHWLTPITTITTAPVYASTWLFTLKMHYKQPMMHIHAEVLMQKNTPQTFIEAKVKSMLCFEKHLSMWH